MNDPFVRWSGVVVAIPGFRDGKGAGPVSCNVENATCDALAAFEWTSLPGFRSWPSTIRCL